LALQRARPRRHGRHWQQGAVTPMEVRS
jgi:hypothetical protein